MNREDLFAAILELRRQGKSIRAIAADLGVNRGRVARALKAIYDRSSPGSSPFVGRKSELDTLTLALDATFSGRGQLAMLAGQPGIGKSRTCQQIAFIAEERGAQIIWGRCYEGPGAPPYWPWIQIIRSLIQKLDLDQPRSTMGTGAADMAEIVPEVKQIFPDLDSSRSSDPDQARFQLFDSITSFLTNAAANRPLVLLFDDLHHADTSSLLLLEFLSHVLSDNKVFVVGTYRDEGLSLEHPLMLTLAELARHPNFQRINLGGLTHKDTSELIQHVSGKKPSSDLAHVVFAQTEGNPLFANELIKMLAQDEALTPLSVEGRHEIRSKVPDGVKEAIAGRLHPLSPNCIKAITVASLIGREFEIELLRQLISELSLEQLLQALEEALLAGFIEENPVAPGHYQFKHVLFQETLSQEFSAIRRAVIHGQIGEALEGLYANDVEPHADELAYHFSEAGTAPGNSKLVRYSMIAGERALATYAWDVALGHFERGLAAKEEQAIDADKAALLFGLARAQSATFERHRLHEVPTTARCAFEYYVKAGDVPGALAIAKYPFPWGPTFIEALDLVPADSLDAGRLLARIGSSLSPEIVNYETSIKALEEALSIAVREKDAALEISVLVRIAEINWMLRLDPQASREYALKAVGRVRSAGLDQSIHFGHWWLAVANIALGDLEQAWPHAQAHLRMAEKLGDHFRIAQGSHANAVVAQLRGDWEESRSFSDRGLAVANRDGRLVSNRAALEYQLGEFHQGSIYVDLLVDTMRLASSVPALHSSLVPLRIGTASQITDMTHMFDIAEETAHTILSLQSPISVFNQVTRTGLALIAIARRDSAEARKQYDALKSWPLAMTPLTLICTHRVLGLLAQTIGRLDDAADHFEDSLVFCRKAGARPEAAWTCYDYAGVLTERDNPGDEAAAASLITEAIDISTELDMRPLVSKAIALRENMHLVPAKTPEAPASLTNREIEVLRLISSGESNSEIADELVVSIRTVERHVSNIYSKTGLRGRASATVFAFTSGLIPPPSAPE